LYTFRWREAAIFLHLFQQIHFISLLFIEILSTGFCTCQQKPDKNFHVFLQHLHIFRTITMQIYDILFDVTGDSRDAIGFAVKNGMKMKA